MIRQIFIILSLTWAQIYAQQAVNWTCTRVQSLVRVEYYSTFDFFNSKNITIYYQNNECRKCNLIPFIHLSKDSEAFGYFGSRILDAHYDYHFQVVSADLVTGENETVCEKFLYTKFGECGEYVLDIANCNIRVTKQPNDQNLGLYIGVPLIFVIILIFNLFEKLYPRAKRSVDKWIQRSVFRDSANRVAPSIQLEPSNPQSDVKPNKPPEAAKMRYVSLDIFRGFSIICMIFVTYGYATYKFFYHVLWASFNLSTLVMPWFIWIMGVSIPIALNAILSKPNANRWRVLVKIVWRSIKLFGIGLILNIDYDWQWSTIRYFGVLQRIALCYFVLALVELIFWRKFDAREYTNKWTYYVADLIFSIPHTAVVLLILFIWYMVVYLLPVPGCPKGYLGAGGLEDGGKYFNCTGGATGYVDLTVLGYSHLYKYPTQFEVYQTGNYEPEGIMGTLTSIVLAYFGVIAGRVFIFYPNRMRHFWTLLVWFLITFVLFGAITQFDMENGAEPVVKNIWTFSFTLLSASSSFFILAVLYFLIDIKQLWNGNPFVYVGCNSLFIYICHYLFLFQFPVQWKMPNLHLEKFLMCIWGSTFWSIIAAYLYYKKTFFNI